MNKQIEKIDYLIKNKKLSEAINEIDDLLNEDLTNVELLLKKADILYKISKKGEALKIYNKVLEIDKDNIIAKKNSEMIKDFFKFYTPDIFSSTNMYNDPWLD